MKTRALLSGVLYVLASVDPIVAADASGEARVKELVQALEDENADIALAAGGALARMGKPAVLPLIEALGSPKNDVRQLAAQALGRIGAPAQDAEPALVRLLEDKEGRVQNAAAEALGSLKAQQKETIPALLKAMQGHGGNYISTSAARSLGKLGPDVAPMLLDSFRDEHSTGAHTAVWAFEAMGPRAVPALVKAMDDPSPGVQSGVFGSLKRIGAPAVPELVRLLQSDQIALRRGAARALGWLGRPEAAATAALAGALRSPDAELREASLYALGQLRAEGAIAAIREARDDKNERVRFEARMALQALGPAFQVEPPSRDRLAPLKPKQVGEIGRLIGHTEGVTHVAFLPDGRRVLSAEGEGAAVRLWDLASAKEIRCLRISDARQALAVSADGRWVACGGMYRRLRLLDLETGKEQQQFGGQGYLMVLAIRPQGSRVVSVDVPHVTGPPWTVHVWDVASGKESHSFPLPFSQVLKLAFSADGHRLMAEGISTLARDGKCGPIGRIWDVDSQKPVFGRVLSQLASRVGWRAVGVDAAVFSFDGRKILVADSTRQEGLALWDIEAGKERHRMGNRSKVYAMALSPDCRRALAGRGDGTIDLYDLPQGRIVATFRTSGGPVRALAFSPDGGCAISGGPDRLIRVWGLPD